MKKGLTLTLITVAIAMLGIQAMAEAPMISDLPSPVVGDADQATGAARFVYPQAFDLTAYVSDDNTADTAIKWSYEVADTGKYMINGVEPVDSSAAGADTVIKNPDATGKQINAADLDPDKVGTDPNKITIRDIQFSPIGSAEVDPGTTNGVIDTSVVTLYASDGTTYSSKTSIFWTELGGSDHLSTGQQQGTPIYSWGSFASDKHGFTFTDFGGVTTTSGTGMCMTVGTSGDNYGFWTGTPGSTANGIALVTNAVYHLRATMTGSAASAGTTPLWDWYTTNNSNSMYGSDLMFYDAETGINSLTTTPKTIDFWFTPPAVASQRWQDGSKTTALEANDNNKVFLGFRVLDIGARTDLNCAIQAGTLCVTEANLERFDLSAMTVLSQDYQCTDFKEATSANNGSVLVYKLLGSNPTLTYATTGLTIVPDSAMAGTELVYIWPASNNVKPDTKAYTDATMLNNYVAPWKDDTLYQFVVEMDMPSGATAPPDAYLLSLRTPDNEILQDNYQTNLGGFVGMPDATSRQFMCFMFGHKETTSPSANVHFLMPQIQIVNNGSFVESASTGTIHIKSLTVNEVQF